MRKVKSGSSVYEVMDYGMIAAGDAEIGILITVNGAYLNCWVGNEEQGWTNTDCRYMHDDLYSITAAKAWDLAKEYLADIQKGDEEEEVS